MTITFKRILLALAVILVGAGGVFAFFSFTRRASNPSSPVAQQGQLPRVPRAIDNIGSSTSGTTSMRNVQPPEDPNRAKFYFDDGNGDVETITEGEFYDMRIPPLIRTSGTRTAPSVVPPPETTVSSLDADRDGLTDAEEANLKTDPNGADTDGDGLADGREVKTLRTNPRSVDTDNDALSDFEEAETYGTNPNLKDTDGDGFGDGVEVSKGYNPLGAGKL